MLTPRFTLHQDDQFVYISIHAPYSSIKDNECLIEDNDFIFFASPYFLRLRLPGRLKDSDLCSGSFDCNCQTYSIKIEKENYGEVFENLNTITNLLIPCVPENPSFNDKIEVVTSINYDNQSPSSIPSNGYGFGNKILSKFNTFELFTEVFDFSPDLSIEERKSKRKDIENGSFSSDHYLADLYDLEYIQEHLDYVGPWQNQECTTKFTNSEIDLLKELPNKEYIFTTEEKKGILIGIIDIIFPLMYELRTTASDLNPESSWTVNKLSSTLSCSTIFETVEECIISLFRRSLIYPLYRNYDLLLAILNDTKIILNAGKIAIIKRFIEIHLLFNLSQASRYILNDMFIKDYLIFLQKIDDSDITWLIEELNNTQINKDKLCLELIELEKAAEIVKNENTKDYEEITHLMSKCANLNADDTDSDDTSDETSDSDSSSSSSSSSEDKSKDDYGQLYVNTQAQ